METNKLHHIKNTGFKAPQDYFDALDKTILSKLESDTPLSQVKETGYTVPDDYFDVLDDRIFNNIETVKATTKVIPLLSKKTIWLASSAAAAVLLLFNLSIFESKPTFDGLDTQSVENYILNETMSSSEIASLFNDEELDINIFEDQNLDDNHIEDYLLDDTDIETLMIE